MKIEPIKSTELIGATDMVDVVHPEYVEILIRADGRVVWINVDGECKFRAMDMHQLIIQDERKALGVSPIHDTAGTPTPADKPVGNPVEVEIRQNTQNKK